MSTHLTSQQISEFVAGTASAAGEDHIRECLACRSEIEHIGDTLGLFRQAVRQWSLEQEFFKYEANDYQKDIPPVRRGPGGPGGRGGPGSRGPGRMSRPPASPASSTSVERALQAGPSGTWWRDAALVQKIGLSPEQQKKIEDAFQQSRLHLIDLTATLEKEQVTMEPLLAADHPDEAKILVQIDRIAQARAELEKSNARMLLGFRNVLSQDQWVRLKAEKPAQSSQPGPQHSGPQSGRGSRQGPPPGGGR